MLKQKWISLRALRLRGENYSFDYPMLFFASFASLRQIIILNQNFLKLLRHQPGQVCPPVRINAQ